MTVNTVSLIAFVKTKANTNQQTHQHARTNSNAPTAANFLGSLELFLEFK